MWRSHDNETWTMTGHKAPPDQLANAMIKRMASLEMERADEHYCGKGMGNGVHFWATLSHLRSLTPEQFATRSLLENILAASNWTADRIHSISPDYPVLCPRCGLEPETPLHCYWTCPAMSMYSSLRLSSQKRLQM